MQTRTISESPGFHCLSTVQKMADRVGKTCLPCETLSFRANLRVERETVVREAGHCSRGQRCVALAAMPDVSGNGGNDEKESGEAQPPPFQIYGVQGPCERPGNVLVCDPHR